MKKDEINKPITIEEKLTFLVDEVELLNNNLNLLIEKAKADEKTNEKLFDVNEVAEQLNVTTQTIKNYIKKNKLAIIKVNNNNRIAKSELEAFKERSKKKYAKEF